MTKGIKRARGAGSIRTNDNGTFRPRLPRSLGRRWLAVYRTADEAAGALDLEIERLSKAEDPDSPTAFGRYGRRVLEGQDSHGRQHAHASQLSIWKQVERSALGKIETTAVKERDVRRMLNAMTNSKTGKESAPSSKRNIKNTISGILDHAAGVDFLIEANPITRIRIKGRSARKESLSADELDAVFSVPMPMRNMAAIVVATTAGLRAGEVHGLRWRDIRWDDADIFVQMARDLNTLKPTKTHRKRLVEMLPPAIAALMLWKAEYQRLGVRSHLDLVFPGKNGGPRYQGYDFRFSEAWQTASDTIHRNTGVRPEKKPVFGGLRHAGCQLLLSGAWVARGWADSPWLLRRVSRHLGHKNVSTTEDYYADYRRPDGGYSKRTAEPGTEPEPTYWWSARG